MNTEPAPACEPAETAISDGAALTGTESTGRPRLSWRRLGVLLTAGIATASVPFAMQPAPYMLMEPGPAPDVTASVTGDIRNPQFGKHGHMHFTTVQVSELNWFEYAQQRFAPTDGTRLVTGLGGSGGDDSGAAAAALHLMAESKITAWQLADARVNGGSSPEGLGARVLTVTAGSAAQIAGVQSGDKILAVDASVITTAEQLPDIVATAPVHSTLHIERDGTRLQLPVTFTTGAGRQVLGVQLGTVLDTEQTPRLTVDTPGIAGPSAGLMFTLSFIDALSTGDLTADRNIAGTGTIAVDGTVGPINGIEEKVVAAHRAGAGVFFAPVDNAVAAHAAAPAGLTVVAVGTYNDAVNWLCTNGATSGVCTP
jgi:PDZ domain-containing protein